MRQDEVDVFYKAFESYGESYLRGAVLSEIARAGLEPDHVALVRGALRDAGPGRYVLEVAEIVQQR